MKSITVKQPWASLIIDGVKDIENRTWKCPQKYIGQRMLIHASASQIKKFNINLTDEQMKVAFGIISERAINGKFEFGEIIGSVEIVDCVINHPSIWAEKTEMSTALGGVEVIIGKQIYNWVLANPIKFPTPIPAKGKLSFWDFEMHCPEFSHFGATYPDASCIDGYLWDLDSDENGCLTQGGEDPCPYCSPKQYLSQQG